MDDELFKELDNTLSKDSIENIKASMLLISLIKLCFSAIGVGSIFIAMVMWNVFVTVIAAAIVIYVANIHTKLSTILIVSKLHILKRAARDK